MGPGNEVQVVRLVGRCLHLLSHLSRLLSWSLENDNISPPLTPPVHAAHSPVFSWFSSSPFSRWKSVVRVTLPSLGWALLSFQGLSISGLHCSFPLNNWFLGKCHYRQANLARYLGPLLCFCLFGPSVFPSIGKKIYKKKKKIVASSSVASMVTPSVVAVSRLALSASVTSLTREGENR